jgi:hypothetical protein
MTLQAAPSRAPRTVWLIVILALVGAGCGSPDAATRDLSSTTSVPVTSQPVAVPVPDTAELSPIDTDQVLSPDAGQSDPKVEDEPAGEEAGSLETTTLVSAGDGGEAQGSGDPISWSEELASRQASGGDAEGLDDLSPLPTAGPGVYLGGSPDDYAAAVLTSGLEEAGVDLTGITLHVLPVTGVGASLLVLEVGDAYAESSLLTGEEGEDITGALLALPELEAAAITELVVVYRGVDEEGPFTMTFVVSIDALERAYATAGDLGDDLLVQVDRGS